MKHISGLLEGMELIISYGVSKNYISIFFFVVNTVLTCSRNVFAYNAFIDLNWISLRERVLGE